MIKDLSALIFEGTLINEALVRSLYGGSFLDTRCNIILVGGTGTGKTHLATAITANVRAPAPGAATSSSSIDLCDHIAGTEVGHEVGQADSLQPSTLLSDCASVVC